MQNKGAVKFFVIAFALVCIFQLSFTFFTSNVEKNARKFSNNDAISKMAKDSAKGDPAREKLLFDSLKKAKESYYLDSMSNVVVFNLGFRKYTYKECKDREINLGLDLKGGMNVTLEISVVDIIRAMANNTKDVTFNKAIDQAIEMQKTSQKDFLTLFADAFKTIDPNAKLSSPNIFGTTDLKDRISYNSTNEEVLKVIKTETDGAIDRTFNILRTRIDRFGVSQPNIQKLSTAGRILVELPGIKDPLRVRKLLQGTAKLEFWETYDYKDVYGFLEAANKKLASIVLKSDTNKVDSTKLTAADSLAKLDKKGEKKDLKKDAKKEVVKAKVDTADKKSLVDKKLAEKKDNKPGDKAKKGEQSFEEYAKENPLFAYLKPAVVQDEKGQYFPNKGPRVGYTAGMDTAKVNVLLHLASAKGIFPKDLKFLWSVKPVDKGGTTFELIAIKVSNRDGKAPLGGEVIVDARQDFGQNNSNEISMSMNSEGAKVWKRLTAENIGKSIAIVLDDYVYSYPTVNGEIPNGRSSISGAFTLEEAKDLANILKAGKLPAPARIVEEAVVGPTLGQEAINAGLMSFVFAFIGVLLYMSLYYNRAGHVADVALFANVFFLFGVLASIGAVLTLPGIAGIVLTLAMAVDSNVIIYERMREEERMGKGARLMVKDGFHHAYSAIIDGHVTTILTGIVLYTFGSGPIQGFATTLIIGLVLSLFTSIFVSRLVFEWMLNKNMKITLGNRFTDNIFLHTKINFIGLRKKLYVVSGVIITIGIISLIIKGLSFGVDFKGGRTYIVRFDKDVKTEDIRTSLANVIGDAPEVKTFGPNNQVKITTKYLIESNSPATDSIVESKIWQGLKSQFPNNTYEQFSTHKSVGQKTVGILSSQKVGPTIAKDLVYSAYMAVFFALIIIFIYIAIRFKNWQYGLGGVISLAHDTMMIITAFTLLHGIMPFNMEVDQSFIAAILTIIGYSIMDTVIIFDRIREYNILYPKRELSININGAINSTLGRTINTSGVTLVVLITIFIFGGEILRGFVFALLLGVIVGTYSSVFNATPVAYDIIKWGERRKAAKLLKK
ncbi:MAG: protein translocase subunit SecDF [Bacteroidetes bacterium]|nr:protein translocase subunit SecDF [Bacteroidota bacterium]